MKKDELEKMKDIDPKVALGHYVQENSNLRHQLLLKEIYIDKLEKALTKDGDK